MDLVARFQAYVSDFERSYADGDWSRLGPYFAPDAVYDSVAPEPLGFRVVGRAAILEHFANVTAMFDRRFDTRVMHTEPPYVEHRRVALRGVVVYTLRDTPPLRLPFSEIAEYRSGEIVRLQDSASPEDVRVLTEWLAMYGDRLSGLG